jgi:hypothetical protein
MILRLSTVADLTNKFGFPTQEIGFTLKRKRTIDRRSALPINATEEDVSFVLQTQSFPDIFISE